MKVTATTLPRRSPRASRSPSAVVSANGGAAPLVGRPVSRRVAALEFLLQLVEEAPVGALGKDLLGTGLDHPDLMQAKRIEADSVLGVIFPPLVVGDVLQGR